MYDKNLLKVASKGKPNIL